MPVKIVARLPRRRAPHGPPAGSRAKEL